MGNTSLTIRCPQPVEWKITLPVKIDVFQDVIVNKTPLIKGQPIDENRLQYQKTEISRLTQGYFRDIKDVTDLQPKRNMMPGTVLNPANLVARKMVESGQRVTILFKSKGLQIRSNGQALQSARYGDLIKVRNISSNRVIEAIVSAPGQVSVGL